MFVSVIEKQVFPESDSSWFSWYAILKRYNFTPDISKQIQIYWGPLLRMKEIL